MAATVEAGVQDRHRDLRTRWWCGEGAREQRRSGGGSAPIFPQRVLDRFLRYSVSDIGISSVTAAELAVGVAKSRSAKNRVALETFLLPLNVAPFDLAAAFAYGDLRAELERRGQPIGPLDLQIAAHAISLGTILITNNEREFRRVPSLKVQNWA